MEGVRLFDEKELVSLNVLKKGEIPITKSKINFDNLPKYYSSFLF
jgi:hypothetical protein